MLREGYECKLKVILAETGIRQKALCEPTGLKPPAISAIVNGDSDPHVTTALIIAEIVGRPIQEIWLKQINSK
ncbi:helix-turn-helix domain-containing protein [Paenibacillus koleovorans]|uniref:helix-turn-helix domain-containing protein n=1 Tax=Paenibacillus koleovorans TaxID=121608 RepID=UPI000FDA4291